MKQNRRYFQSFIPLPPFAVFIGLSLGCVSGSVSDSALQLKDPRTADPFDVVDCLLPGQIRQLGSRVTYVTERRPIRTTAEDCAIRGGEYVALDRSDYATALKVWMNAAEGGDPDAQYYVGVLYEKGADGEPNYAKAASWYRQAAEKGIARAAVNLGRLYDRGLGVEQNSEEARKWFAKATGIREGAFTDLEASKAQTEALQAKLEAVQRDLSETRSRLTERTSLLDDERRKLEQLKKEAETPKAVGQGKGPEGGEAIARQERMVKERETEVEKLQAQITSLIAANKQQAILVQKAPPKDVGLRGPTIQIIDPAVVLTRGIRMVEGRIPVIIPRGKPLRLTGRAMAEAGIRSLTVNGESAVFDEQGLFIVSLNSKGAAGSIPVDLVAMDRQGREAGKKLVVSSGDSVTAKDGVQPTTFSGAGEYHALIIGNDHYRHWTPLNTAIADANAAASLFRTRYGFRVTVLRDAGRKDILKALNDYRKTLSVRDNLLIYYAGHGFLEPEIDRGYWIPVEGDLFDNTEWIEFPAITDLLELIPAKQVLVIADSCFAGKLARSSMARINPDVQDLEREKLLKAITEKKTRTTLTSGGAKPVLDEGGAGHSIFANALLGVLSENSEVLETERLYWTVRARVVQSAEHMKFEQIPTYGPIHMAGHEGFGDFVFVPIRN